MTPRIGHGYGLPAPRAYSRKDSQGGPDACVRRDGSLTIEATGPPGSGVPAPCPTQSGAGLGQAGSCFFSGCDGGVSYRREILRRTSPGGVPSLKITASMGQGRFWVPRKALQQINLETIGGWALGRRHDLGPHRGLMGRVVGRRHRVSRRSTRGLEASDWPPVLFGGSGEMEERP